MSYDIRIARTPGPIEPWSSGSPTTRGAIVDGDEPLVVRRGKSDSGVELWAPAACEVDDVDDEVAGAVLAPRWLTEITLPIPAPKADLSLARALARGLAEACEGAAFDPQHPVQRLLPEAAPVRYGDFEPLQERLEPGREQWLPAP